MNNIEKLILEFNDNELNHNLRDYYQTKSFLDRFNKGRDEEAHSGFIAWLLSNSGFSGNAQNSPLINFLELLIRNNDAIDHNLKRAILSRSISMSNLKVKCEQKIKELSRIPTEDELDIFIECNLSGVGKYHKLQIFIENKIYSPEEGPKKDAKNKDYQLSIKELHNVMAECGKMTDIHKCLYKYFWQTNRYYLACQKDMEGNDWSEGLLQLFVYISPNSTPHSKKFSVVTYQDLLDYVILPFYNEGNLSAKDKIFTEEYIKCLSLPTEDIKTSKRLVLALSGTEKARLEQFCNNSNNQALIQECLYAIIKFKSGKTALTSDEKLLLSFFENNRTLFDAAALAISGSALSSTANDCVTYYDSPTKTFDYVFIKDGHVLGATEAGTAFGKAFYDAFYQPGDTDATLNQKVKNEMQKYGNKTIGSIFGESGTTYGYVQHQQAIIKTNGYWGTRSTDAYPKLCEYLLAAKPAYFKFDKILKF